MQLLSAFSVLVLAATAAASVQRAHVRLHMRRHEGYGYNTTITSTPILSTGYDSPPQETVAPSVTDVEIITEVVDKTLTYTLGSGSTAQEVTTTVKQTSTRTVTHVLTLTRAPTDTSPTNVAEQDVPGNDAEPNTTIRQTSVLTKVVTVYQNTASGVQAQETGAGAGGGACAAPSTVYVTEQETVYVTAGAPSASDAAVNTEAVHTGGPKQSSESVYYPTGGEGESGGAAPTGAVPTGYVRRSFRAPVRL